MISVLNPLNENQLIKHHLDNSVSVNDLNCYFSGTKPQ